MEKLIDELQKTDLSYRFHIEDDFNSIHAENGTPLLIALAKKDHEKALREFIKLKPANIDVRDSSDDTPLSWSAYNGNMRISEELLIAGANPNIICCSGRPIMHWVCTKNHENIISLLIEYNADLELVDSERKTALFFALGHCAKCVDILLAHGANVNHVDAYGNIPIMFVKTLPALNKLLSYGSKVNWKNDKGKTPLMAAAKISSELVFRLIEAGADVNAQCNLGLNVGFEAIKYTKKEIVDFLLKYPQFDTSARDRENNTLLHYAFNLDFCSVIPDLIERIDLMAKNKNGESVLDCSLQHSNHASIFYLMKRDIRTIDASNLEIAAEENMYISLFIGELRKLREKNKQMVSDVEMLEIDIRLGNGGPEFIKARNEFNKLRNMGEFKIPRRYN